MPPRAPLTPISGNKTPRKEVDIYLQGQIIGMAKAGVTPTRISNALSIPRATIYGITERNRDTTTPTKNQRTGRPRKLSKREERYILRAVRQEPMLTYAQLKAKLGFQVSRKTYYRILKRHGITNWLAKKRPLLEEDHAKARLTWAKGHKDWSFDEWKHIFWSDESTVERTWNYRKQWAFGKPSQRWDRDKIQPKNKGKDVSIMIWAMIWGVGKSEIVRAIYDEDSKGGGVTANTYIQLLEENLLAYYEPGYIFMQDNAPSHKAQKTKDWFAYHGIEVTEWPPNSPDLNPIEHCWNWIKDWIDQNRPDLHLLPRNNTTTLDALFQAIEEAWDAMPDSYIESLIRSMDTRVNAVIEAEGWYTRY